MSLRGAFAATWQSPVRGDCSPTLTPGASVAQCARNDMEGGTLREVQSHKGMLRNPRAGRSCDPHPVLPPNPTPQRAWGRRADLPLSPSGHLRQGAPRGEGELRFWMKREVINFETLTVIVAES